MTLRDWTSIIDRARFLVNQFTDRFGRPPTLRRLHYELVSDALATSLGYFNTQGCYKQLSAKTAEGRRDNTFPDLSEDGRNVTQVPFFSNANQIRERVRQMVKVDRMRDQEYSVCMVVEKAGSRQFLEDWFSAYGVLIAAVGGYGSQTQVNIIRNWQAWDKRPMKVFYAGDFDASGEDISRDFTDRLLYAGTHDIDLVRVAILPEHVAQYNLPAPPSDKNDSRAASFASRHGQVTQTELDSMDPDILRGLYQDAFDQIWDYDLYEEQKGREQALIDEVLGS
jgi:hypothetical protein